MNLSCIKVKVVSLLLFFLLSVFLGANTYAAGETENTTESSVMAKFTADAKDNAIVDEEVKHKVLFWMGVILLVLIIATAAIGINMAFFGKEVFVAHMVFAGGTVFLSLAHAVTAMVWFFPY